MSSNTPYLGLLKKDPTTDGNETFNIKTMLNENWDKIDFATDGLQSRVTKVEDRLNVPSSADITLQPGLQILKGVERDSLFKLGSIKGRTLINLTGRIGKGDDPSKLINYFLTSTVESGSTKITLSSSSVGSLAVRPITFSSGKKYILLGDVKNGNTTEDIFIQCASANTIEIFPLIKSLDSSKFVTIATKYAPSADLTTGSVEAVFQGTAGQYAWVKNLRAYEISEAEYFAIDSMSSEQLADKYPYVYSVTPVSNPYAIRYGENLLPPFTEWLTSPIGGTYDIKSAYELAFTGVADKSYYLYVEIPLMPNTDYCLSANHNGYLSVTNTELNVILVANTQDQSINFNTGASTAVRIYLSNVSYTGTAGSFYFAEPMLNIGSTQRTFKPRVDNMIALQTDLFADPVTGGDADEVFSREGQYLKLEKWKKSVLDGALSYSLRHTTAGFKVVSFPLQGAKAGQGQEYGTMIKYDGSLLANPKNDTLIQSDMWSNRTWESTVILSIANADSGWGESYTPTLDEIKAYFMGWKMCDGVLATNTYNGSGIKYWVYRLDGISNDINNWDGTTTTLPSTKAPNWNPYKLLYKLATPVVEAVVSDGCFTLIEGDNQIEVGTGIVLREGVKPALYVDGGVQYYWLNNLAVDIVTGSHSVFEYSTNNILKVLKNNVDESSKWTVFANHDSAPKKGMIAMIRDDKYEQSAFYSATYIKLDKSPVVPITGTVATNEKAQLTDLTAGVQEALQRVSVVEMKKAEKDAPGWITPTLLNGWVSYNNSGYTTVRFFKDSLGFVHIDGLIKNGSILAGTTVFVLPVGYRPSQALSSASVSEDAIKISVTRIKVETDGQVRLSSGALRDLAVLNIPPFLAEQ
ncbi:hypothetical protein GRF59_13165 [Paenibacillus sp. HJL G12]|uniref:Uncharacterized protein n=1 Tax=Paenibacillus dendrobii TaxID=2691084 RepID=A0A7X3IJD7_9BACL|nr:hypothetical protein [Paenibacillus dendrobii]MWV44578.1 hypothetical protein [Paenibacillus dendrobii]